MFLIFVSPENSCPALWLWLLVLHDLRDCSVVVLIDGRMKTTVFVDVRFSVSAVVLIQGHDTIRVSEGRFRQFR